MSVKAVKSMHSLHLWALTLGQALVSVHLAVGNDILTHSALNEITQPSIDLLIPHRGEKPLQTILNSLQLNPNVDVLLITLNTSETAVFSPLWLQRKEPTLSLCCRRPQTCYTPSLVSTASPSRWSFTVTT